MLAWLLRITWAEFLVCLLKPPARMSPIRPVPSLINTITHTDCTHGLCSLPFRCLQLFPSDTSHTTGGSHPGSAQACTGHFVQRCGSNPSLLWVAETKESLSPGPSTPLPHWNLPPFIGPELLDYYTRCKFIGGSCSHVQSWMDGLISFRGETCQVLGASTIRQRISTLQDSCGLCVWLEEHKVWGHGGERI